MKTIQAWFIRRKCAVRLAALCLFLGVTGSAAYGGLAEAEANLDRAEKYRGVRPKTVEDEQPSQVRQLMTFLRNGRGKKAIEDFDLKDWSIVGKYLPLPKQKVQQQDPPQEPKEEVLIVEVSEDPDLITNERIDAFIARLSQVYEATDRNFDLFALTNSNDPTAKERLITIFNFMSHPSAWAHMETCATDPNSAREHFAQLFENMQGNGADIGSIRQKVNTKLESLDNFNLRFSELLQTQQGQRLLRHWAHYAYLFAYFGNELNKFDLIPTSFIEEIQGALTKSMTFQDPHWAHAFLFDTGCNRPLNHLMEYLTQIINAGAPNFAMEPRSLLAFRQLIFDTHACLLDLGHFYRLAAVRKNNSSPRIEQNIASMPSLDDWIYHSNAIDWNNRLMSQLHLKEHSRDIVSAMRAMLAKLAALRAPMGMVQNFFTEAIADVRRYEAGVGLDAPVQEPMKTPEQSQNRPWTPWTPPMRQQGDQPAEQPQEDENDDAVARWENDPRDPMLRSQSVSRKIKP